MKYPVSYTLAISIIAEFNVWGQPGMFNKGGPVVEIVSDGVPAAGGSGGARCGQAQQAKGGFLFHRDLLILVFFNILLPQANSQPAMCKSFVNLDVEGGGRATYPEGDVRFFGRFKKFV